MSNVEGSMKSIEDLNGAVSGDGINRDESYLVSDYIDIRNLKAVSKTVKGYPLHVVISKLNKDADITQPTFQVEIVNDTYVPINQIPYTEDFLKDIVIGMKSINENIVKVLPNTIIEVVDKHEAYTNEFIVNSKLYNNKIVGITISVTKQEEYDFSVPTVSVKVE